MPDRNLAVPRARLEYLGPITPESSAPGAVGHLLDSVDIWLAGKLDTLFTFLKR